VRRLDPWSVLKFALMYSVALFVVWMVAVGVLYGVLDNMGVFDTVNDTVRDLTDSGGDNPTGGIEVLISARGVLGWAAVLGMAGMVLFVATATIAAFLYNLSADIVGGIEVTLTERE